MLKHNLEFNNQIIGQTPYLPYGVPKLENISLQQHMQQQQLQHQMLHPSNLPSHNQILENAYLMEMLRARQNQGQPPQK